tara:strand:+ start:350806 stop:351426 length:621 start_codon:yes stop_codon:yes gene_type:complete
MGSSEGFRGSSKSWNISTIVDEQERSIGGRSLLRIGSKKSAVFLHRHDLYRLCRIGIQLPPERPIHDSIIAEQMAKRKPEIKMRTFGIYSKWDGDSKELPRFTRSTTRVRAKIGVEFGFVVDVKNCKNRQLHYCIDHPGILDADGKKRPPFDGMVYVKTNDWKFYLGDTIWEPVDDKLGDWRLTLEMDDQLVAEKTFQLHLDDQES